MTVSSPSLTDRAKKKKLSSIYFKITPIEVLGRSVVRLRDIGVTSSSHKWRTTFPLWFINYKFKPAKGAITETVSHRLGSMAVSFEEILVLPNFNTIFFSVLDPWLKTRFGWLHIPQC